MSTISLGRSGIVGISYNETSLLKSNLIRANERINSASNNINSAKVKFQVNGRSGRIRVETDNLQSYYSSLKSNNSKIEKIIRDIDYIVRRFKEVDSRCAIRIRAISKGYKVQSFISKISNSLISFGSKVFNGISNFFRDGISIIKNIYNSSVSWTNNYGFYGSLASGNFNLGMYPGLAMAGMGVEAGVTTLGPIIPGGITNNNKGVEEYLKKSFNQLLLGNFTNDVTVLGTVGQVGLGLLGADLPLDIRDISADFIKWEWSWKHAGQTALDLLALLPIIGAVKYADEAWLGLKNGFKVIKNSDIINKIGLPLLDSAKAIGAYIKKAPNLTQYFRGGIKNIGEHIDNVGYSIRKVMGFEPELVADGVRIGDIRDTRKLNGNDVSNLNDTQKNYNKILNGGDGVKGVSNPKLYNPIEFEGTVKVNGQVRDVSRRVYQRGDIDVNFIDKDSGLTNLELMKKGRAPIGSDGKPIQLHHLTQQEAGSMVEILESTHQNYTKQLHGLIEDGQSFRNNPILEKQYNNFRSKYWKWRYEQLTK